MADLAALGPAMADGDRLLRRPDPFKSGHLKLRRGFGYLAALPRRIT